MNSFNAIGRLSKDPEIKATSAGMQICKFTVAVNRSFKKEGQPEADFIDCTAFSKTAELIGKHFFKGKEIGISGSLQIDTWKDDNQQYRSRPNVIVESITFIGKKEEHEEAYSAPKAQPVAAEPLKKKEKKAEPVVDEEADEEADEDNIPAWLKNPENS